MERKSNLLMRVSLETPEGIQKNIVALLPWITEAYELEMPVLSFDNQNPKERYKLVWVMAAHSKADKTRTYFCFYPMKKKFLQRSENMATPLDAPGSIFPSKYGPMEVVEINGELALQTNNLLLVIE